ncbi:hypothetical protein K0M31_009997 [Melipona bicolor]|uniref:Uncharacterized protein n=1 Tax=Melipona bicolor TaxID=60889 RepID=A0AA40FMN7_9HYME|nr:hypothetical protein K0M31_009997 [Melipona bicolor]
MAVTPRLRSERPRPSTFPGGATRQPRSTISGPRYLDIWQEEENQKSRCSVGLLGLHSAKTLGRRRQLVSAASFGSEEGHERPDSQPPGCSVGSAVRQGNLSLEDCRWASGGLQRTNCQRHLRRRVHLSVQSLVLSAVHVRSAQCAAGCLLFCKGRNLACQRGSRPVETVRWSGEYDFPRERERKWQQLADRREDTRRQLHSEPALRHHGRERETKTAPSRQGDRDSQGLAQGTRGAQEQHADSHRVDGSRAGRDSQVWIRVQLRGGIHPRRATLPRTSGGPIQHPIREEGGRHVEQETPQKERRAYLQALVVGQNVLIRSCHRRRVSESSSSPDARRFTIVQSSK